MAGLIQEATKGIEIENGSRAEALNSSLRCAVWAATLAAISAASKLLSGSIAN